MLSPFFSFEKTRVIGDLHPHGIFPKIQYPKWHTVKQESYFGTLDVHHMLLYFTVCISTKAMPKAPILFIYAWDCTATIPAYNMPSQLLALGTNLLVVTCCLYWLQCSHSLLLYISASNGSTTVKHYECYWFNEEVKVS